MNKLLIAVIICSSFTMVSAQTDSTEDEKKRPRVIVTDNTPPTAVTATPTPRTPKVITIPRESATSTAPAKPADPNSVQARSLRLNDVNQRLSEAKRQMRVKPLKTSLGETTQTTDVVRLAFYDWNAQKVDYAVLPKPEFLSRKTESLVRSEGGKMVRIQTIRGNGVNTPVIIWDSFNKPQLPLIVQYPIEKYGRFVEMAYYVSTHPGLVTPESVNAGKLYVRNVLDAARNSLRQQGIFIQPKVVDIAERLALVEHVDHSRFRNEFHPRIYNDVYTLYAFNRGQTYRYSVSRAGAGGMVQMIPSTYRMVRSRFYSVGLNPNFVVGMRDHLNASKAMLLYMQMTWNDLVGNQTVFNAMKNGIATQEQLMAAGYNSNPARLPRYIRRGGANWTRLIPRETKMYLKIYSSVEKFVPMTPRTR